MTSEATVIQSQPDANGSPSLEKFLEANGRLPFIDDEIKPWDYRGWLIPYRQMSESHPQVAPRYAYVVATLEAGKLLDEPLPQIHFLGEGEAATKPVVKQINDMMKIVEYRSTSWNAFRDICGWLGYALGVSSERSELAVDIQEKLYRLFDLGLWLLHPSDYLGQYMAEMNHGKRSGYFPTPMTICMMMAKMTFPKDEACRQKTTNDPAVGSGRLLLAASNYSMRLSGNDIDPLCVLVSKINLALYAPWFHIPESFYAEHDAARATVEPADDQQLSRTARITHSTEIKQPTLFEF